MKHVLRILDSSGDTQVTWDPINAEATAIAERKFNELRSQGAQLIRTDGSSGQQVMGSFDPQAQEIVATQSFAGG